MRRSSNTRPTTRRLVIAARQIRKTSAAEHRVDKQAGVLDERGQIADVPSVRPLSESEIADAIDRFQRGELIQSIAARLGVSRKRIRTVFQARGITSKRSPLTAEHVEHAAALYRGGLSLAAVGTEFGVTGMTIRRYLSEHGVKIRPRRGWENYENQQSD